MAVNGDLTSVCVDGESVSLKLRRNAQARRLILRVDRTTAEIKVTVPPRTPQKTIRNFVEQHLGWIQQERAKVAMLEPIVHGAVIPFMGTSYELVYTDQSPRRVVVDSTRIEVGGPADQAPARLERWLRQEAKRILTEDVHHYADMLGVVFNRVSIGDMKTRWGSCSNQKTLKFNWRLVLAPEVVRRYVAAHEVAHLLEMNHSDRFWRHVANCMPDYMTHRRWLKKDGDALMTLRLRA